MRFWTRRPALSLGEECVSQPTTLESCTFVEYQCSKLEYPTYGFIAAGWASFVGWVPRPLPRIMTTTVAVGIDEVLAGRWAPISRTRTLTRGILGSRVGDALGLRALVCV